MKNEHPTHAELIDLYYEPDSSRSQAVLRHLTACRDCRDEYDSLVLTLNQTNLHEVPALTTVEHAELFESVWNRSKASRTSSLNWIGFVMDRIQRPIVHFVAGLACGILLTVSIANGWLDTAVEAKAEPNIRWESNGLSQTVSGRMLEKIYPDIENPTISILNSSGNDSGSQKVLQGTMENGNIQIILNL
ncbi:MAG: hypothetical protein C4527_20990 [Candidatus Omnitrophota bacterium]|jgi:hypothetical protein|nr:MAG: hypothetical protein C4527_20990 [Candidatus Omnitrophota bacterium]